MLRFSLLVSLLGTGLVAQPTATAETPVEADTADADEAKKEPPASLEMPVAEAVESAPPAKDSSPPAIDPDNVQAAEDEDAKKAAVALPVAPDPVQVYGWRENIVVQGIEQPLQAKLDTGALTSSIHAEEKELFERDGKKWVRFVVTDTGAENPIRTRIEAPLVRVARVKEPGAESVMREVVRLKFRIGDRTLRAQFTLNNRTNMLSPVLIGRSTIKELGWVDSSRTNLADQKIFR